MTLAAPMPASAVTLYQQNFDSPDTTGTNSTPVSTFSWAAHRGLNGINSLSGWPANPLSDVSSSQMRVVDDGAAPSGTNRIYSFWNLVSEDVLLWTENFSPIAQSGYSAIDITWSHRNSGSAAAGTRAAVAIDTGSGIRWFASAPLRTNNTASWVQETANIFSANWIEFTFNGT